MICTVCSQPISPGDQRTPSEHGGWKHRNCAPVPQMSLADKQA